VPVIGIGLEQPWNLPEALWRLVRLIRDIRPDVVHTWMYHSDLLGGIAARLAGSRSVLWSVRASKIDVGVGRATHFVRWACARLSGSVPAKISYVAESARQSHERLGYDSAKGVLTVNGFNLPEAALPDNPGVRLRSLLGLDRSTILIGSAGRFHPQKGHRLFVEASARVAAAAPHAHFVMAGSQIDDRNVELAEWISQTGHADRFHLLGELEDLDDWLGDLDIFCLHSLEEGFPNVLGEAMAMALPCVTTDVGDAAALIGKAGIVASADPGALSRALIALIEAAPEDRARMGELARARIAQEFSFEAARRRFERLYDELSPSTKPTKRLAHAPRSSIPASS
jgi:glycosyltransferase involved in cell wall biosynthesis